MGDGTSRHQHRESTVPTPDSESIRRGTNPPGLFRQLWTELTTVQPYRDQHWGALQVTVGVLVSLGVTVLCRRVDLAAPAVFGSLSAVYGVRLGRIDRFRAQLWTGGALTLAVSLGTLVAILPGRAVWSVLVMATMAALGCLLTQIHGWMPVPSLFLVFAAGTLSAQPHRWPDLLPVIGVAAASALFGVAVGQVGLLLRRDLSAAPMPPRVPVREILGAAVSRVELTSYALAPAVAGAFAIGLGFGHPYWAAVSAVVPLAGRTRVVQMGRALSRLVGTAVGIVLAYVLISSDLHVWVIVGVIGAFQVLTELFVTRHYGIAVLFITPMALLLSHVGAPADTASSLVVDRLIQTAIGIGVSVFLVLALDRLLGRRPLPEPGA